MGYRYPKKIVLYNKNGIYYSMSLKDIHIRVPQELYEKISQFKEKEKYPTHSKAIVNILQQYLHQPESVILVENMEHAFEEDSQLKSQQLHIHALEQQIEYLKEQLQIKDKQLIGLIATQGQISTQMKTIVQKIEAPKKGIFKKWFGN